jgi:hypothetical protein
MENPFETNGRDKDAKEAFLRKSLLFIVRLFGIEAFLKSRSSLLACVASPDWTLRYS